MAPLSVMLWRRELFGIAFSRMNVSGGRTTWNLGAVSFASGDRWVLDYHRQQ